MRDNKSYIQFANMYRSISFHLQNRFINVICAVEFRFFHIGHGLGFIYEYMGIHVLLGEKTFDENLHIKQTRVVLYKTK